MKTFWIILIGLVLSVMPAFLTWVELGKFYMIAIYHDTGSWGFPPEVYVSFWIFELIFTLMFVFFVKNTTSINSKFKIPFVGWVLIAAIIFGLSAYLTRQKLFNVKPTTNIKPPVGIQTK